VTNSQRSEEEVVVERELRLHQSEIRLDEGALRELLHPEFLEFGASGTRWTFQSVVERLPTEVPPSIEASDVQCTRLSSGVMLVTYEASINNERSFRSSLWLLTDEGWRIRFHQGTKIP